MNITFKKSVLNIGVASVLTIGAASSAVAAPVAGGGSVAPINTISQVANAGVATMDVGAENTYVISTGVIDSNTAGGFTITIGSLNAGNMKRDGGDTSVGSLAAYTSYILANTAGGVLGTDATPFTTKALVAADVGTKTFTSGAVTTATVAKTYSLSVKFTPTASLIAGAYSDTITMTIAADS